MIRILTSLLISLALISCSAKPESEISKSKKSSSASSRINESESNTKNTLKDLDD